MPNAFPAFLTSQKKILGVLVLFGILAVLLVTLFLRHCLTLLSMDEAHRHQQQLASSLATRFVADIEYHLQSLKVVSRAQAFAEFSAIDRIEPAINGVAEDQEREKRRLLAGLAPPEGHFSGLFLWLPAGESYLAHPFSTQRALNKSNFADRPYFRKARQTREPVISDSFPAASGELSVVIDLPLLDEQNRIKAHLGGVFHLDRLSQLFNEIRGDGFGSGFVVDRKGQLIAHSDATLLTNPDRERFAAHPMLIPPAGPGSLGASDLSTRVFSDPMDGHQYLGTMVPLSWGWRLVLARDVQSISAQHLPPIVHISILVALLLASGAVGLAATWRIGRRGALADQALVESEARLKHIYDHSPVMMHSIDEAGKICNVNRKWLEVTGYDRVEVIGQKADFMMTPESAHRAFSEVIPRFWKDGQVRNIPYQYLTKDGAVIDVLLNCDASVDPLGRSISLSVVRDVTEQKKAENALLRGKEELELRVASRTGELQKTNEELRIEIAGRKQIEEKLRAAAITDELTGLLNRRGFFNLADHQLKIAQRTGKELLFCYGDLDGLKLINDLFGHATGDQAIIDTAEVLGKTFRRSDLLARIGGDEFVVLANETARESEEALASRLQENISRHNQQSKRRYNLSISLGILRYNPERHATIDELLAKADRLMYRQKQAKKTAPAEGKSAAVTDRFSGTLF